MYINSLQYNTPEGVIKGFLPILEVFKRVVGVVCGDAIKANGISVGYRDTSDGPEEDLAYRFIFYICFSIIGGIKRPIAQQITPRANRGTDCASEGVFEKRDIPAS
jgi:hypothetical protein